MNAKTEYTTEELKEREQLTGVIVANLKYIEENDGGDLDELLEKTSTIVANMKHIEQSA